MVYAGNYYGGNIQQEVVNNYMGMQAINHRNRLEKELAAVTHEHELFVKKYDKLAASVTALSERVSDAEKKEKIAENKMSKMIGKIISAKNRITSLNASTPYRPGAVERTLVDVLEDLKNV